MESILSKFMKERNEQLSNKLKEVVGFLNKQAKTHCNCSYEGKCNICELRDSIKELIESD